MVYLSFLAVADAGGIANWVEQNAALGYQLNRTGSSDGEVSSSSLRDDSHHAQASGIVLLLLKYPPIHNEWFILDRVGASEPDF